MMKCTDKRLTDEETGLLASMRGRTLRSLDAVIVARGDMSWNAVRLHLDGMDVDIRCRLGEIEVDELGTVDEFGLMTVVPSQADVLVIPEAGVATTVVEIGEEVLGATIVNDQVEVWGGGLHVATLLYPQAVVLETDGSFIVLDKECWFSEMIAVKRGESPDGLIYDDSSNWDDDPEEDPDTHYVFTTEKVPA